MKCERLLLTVAALGLAACEQVTVHGPVGGATVAVNELCSGAEVVNNLVTKDKAAVIESDGQETYDGLTDEKKLHRLGQHIFPEELIFEEDTWYVMSATGGEDYDANVDGIVDTQTTQINGTVHAILKGSKLNVSAYAISPLTESAYQFMKDYACLLDDNEIQVALDALAPQVMGDITSDEQVDYADLITRNPTFGLDALHLDKVAALDNLADALRDGDPDATLQSLSNALYDSNSPLGVPEAVYEDSISDLITEPINQNGCGPGCHYPNGSGFLASNNKLEPPSTQDFVALNTANFTALVDTRGVSYVVNKASQQIPHTGGSRLPPGSPELATFEAWLNLL